MRLAALALGVALLVGCSSNEVKPAASTEDSAGYLKAIREHFSVRDDKLLLGSGRGVCDKLRSSTRDDEIKRLWELGYTTDQALAMVQISAGYLCPEYKNK